MNWDRVEGSWRQLRGKARAKWGQLTGDQLDVTAGRRDQLVGRVQAQYGIARDQAGKPVNPFTGSFKDGDFKTGTKGAKS